ncbi:MAG: SHOCT domain-containing protein [Candidatus Lambdaproteobacteria bacterium]|nr:SHOCT domain-containing protein [Candidatus Lambdaproteobacteria bacterium]
MMGNFGGWGWGMGFGWLIPLVIIGLVVWAVVTATRSGQSHRGDSALGILKERYARGEIDRETYQAMRRDLE